MPKLWMPGVPRHDTGRRLTMRGNGPRIFTHHTFEAPYSYSPDCRAAAKYLAAQKSDPHFVFHPITGALIQMLPANTGGRTLRAKDPRTGQSASTNTWGTIHMQVEVIAHAARPWTADLTPTGAATLAELLEFLRSWGIPDTWCHGIRPPRYPGPGVPKRQPTASGHFHHAGWVVNNHGDPGAIANPWTVAGTTPPRPPTVPAPGRPPWQTPPHVRAVQALLNTVTDAGLVVDGIRGPATEAATLHYQTTYRADLDPDGSPGPLVLAALGEDETVIKELHTKVEALGTVEVSEATAAELHTGLTGPRPLGWFLDLVGRRVGRTERYVQAARAEVAGLQAVVDTLAEAQGMTRDQVRAIARETIQGATATLTLEAEGEDD